MEHSSIRLSKYFSGDFSPITSLCFSDNSSYLIASTGDTLTSFNVRSSAKHNVLTDKPTGFSMVKFTHNEDQVLSANSVGKQPSITISNLYSQSEYSRTYPHLKSITSLDVCPSSHKYLTSGLDCLLKLWDLRGNQHIISAYMTHCDYNICKFDPSGVVIGMSQNIRNKGYIKFYDTRCLEKCQFYEQEVSDCNITDFHFSNDGTKIAVTNQENYVITVDAISLKRLSVNGPFSSNSNARFSVDSKSVCISNGKDIEIIGDEKSTVKGNISDIQCMEWSHSFYVLAAGCKVLCLYTL